MRERERESRRMRNGEKILDRGKESGNSDGEGKRKHISGKQSCRENCNGQSSWIAKRERKNLI